MKHGDLAIIASLIAIVALMMLPLPGWVLDSLVAINLSFGIILLLIAIYIAEPLEFSVFPSVLLISTLFRLSLSVATTRMILLRGDAGSIIDTFGSMVAGGNLVVGLVVFLIITVVQFVVIARGAERVAEVSARFTLDGLPGKQLSIDSDLRSGLLNKEGAVRKRRMLEQESKLYGSLDGAMKFVKGDSIAGIVIVLINLLGGLTVGMAQQGLPFGAAAERYTILTIGDGLVAQIPALLSAMAAGLIVTRTTDGTEDANLGSAVQRQLLSKPRVLLVAGGLCFLFSFVPGFPAAVFLLLAAAFGTYGAVMTPALRQRMRTLLRPAQRAVGIAERRPPQMVSCEPPAARPMPIVLLELPGGTFSGDGLDAFTAALNAGLDDLQNRLGLPLPAIDISQAEGQSGAWTLFVREAPIGRGKVRGEADADDLLTDVLEATRRNVALFVGIQETSLLVEEANNDYPEVVKEAIKVAPIPRLAEIIRQLVSEDVSIRDMRAFLEGIVEAGQREKELPGIVEAVRASLSRHLMYKYAAAGSLRVVTLSGDLENALRGALHRQGEHVAIALHPEKAASLCRQIQAYETGEAFVVIAAPDLRRPFRRMIERVLFDIPVLSLAELDSAIDIDVIGQLQPPEEDEQPAADRGAAA